MRVQVLQHVPFEGPAAIEPWLRRHGSSVAVTHLFEGGPLPQAGDFDGLVAMGGPMSVNDEDHLSWLIPEKRLIAEAIRQGKPVLGVCLGAQLIANALGAAVRPNGQREIGWYPVTGLPGTDQDPLGRFFSDGPEVFHWHGETFDLPRGARHLLKSAACEHQAFAFGERVLALQFHIETTPESARLLIENCGDELTAGPFIQGAQTMLSDPGRFDRVHVILDQVLGRLFIS